MIVVVHRLHVAAQRLPVCHCVYFFHVFSCVHASNHVCAICRFLLFVWINILTVLKTQISFGNVNVNLIPRKLTHVLPTNKSWVTKSLKNTINQRNIAFNQGDITCSRELQKQVKMRLNLLKSNTKRERNPC